ncbi:MAG: protoglobin domain-containing protein [Woeseiaceae bacterium]
MPNTAMNEQRLRFLDIDQAVIENLRKAREILEPEFDRMLAVFYERISDEPQLKGLFPDDDSMARARSAQKNHWLNSLLAGDFTSAHFDRAELIGRAHARVGLTPNWYIGGYSKMLAQFIQHILAQASENNYDASQIVEALCKAVLLDLDLVIQSYLEAKDRVIFDLLLHATRAIDNLVETNGDIRLASDKIEESAGVLLQGATDDERTAAPLEELLEQVKVLSVNVRQLDARINKLKSGERLYLQSGGEHTGTFSQLVSRIIET